MDRFWQIFAILAGVVVLIIIFGLTGKVDNTQQTMTNETDTNMQEEQATITASTTPEQTSDTVTAVFTTSNGNFSIQLENKLAPATVANFVKLAKEGFYNGQRFHRIIDEFMIQGGDPISKDLDKKEMWGRGGPGYQFADEFGVGLSNVTGTISMANAGPNTNGSQFFINVNDNIFLDGKHAVFGKVVEGMDVVMNLSKVPTDPSDKPLTDVVVEKVEIK